MNAIKIISVTTNNTIDGLVVIDLTKDYQKYLSISRANGIKFNYKKVQYLKNENINNYSIHNKGGRLIMVFNDNYEENKVLKMFSIYLNDICKEKLVNIENSMTIYAKYIN